MGGGMMERFMEYEYQEIKVFASDVEGLERRLKAEGWELYRQEGEQWPIEQATGKVFMQFRKPKQ